MLEFAFTRLEAVRDLAQGTSLGQLTEEHPDKLIPTAEAFGTMLSFEVFDMPGKI